MKFRRREERERIRKTMRGEDATFESKVFLYFSSSLTFLFSLSLSPPSLLASHYAEPRKREDLER